MATDRLYKSRIEFGQATLVAVLHTFLALVATYPLLWSMRTVVVGGGDTVQNVWNLWWVRRSVSHGDFFPYFTQMLYHPTGVSLAYHPLGVLNGWIGSVLQAVLGMNLVLSYNMLTLGSFVLSGLATYYLVNVQVQNGRVAFVASLIFTYAPIRISRVFFGNLEMFSTEFIPLAALAMILLLQTHKTRYAVLAALAVAATAWLSLYLALGTVLLVGVLAGWQLFENRELFVSRLKLLIVFGLMTTALMAPVVAPMLRDYSAFQDQSNPVEASISNSADLLGFFVPDHSLNSLVKRLSPALNELIGHTYALFFGNPAEKTVFIGYSVIVLVVLAGIFARSTLFWKWLIIAILFFILSLGPELHVAGRTLLDNLPAAWLGQIPLVGFGRAPSRLAIFLMLALAVVSSLGLKALESRLVWPKWSTILIGAVVFVEFLAIPMRLDHRFAEIPVYYSQLRMRPDNGAGVLDIPVDLVGAQGPAAMYMLYQMEHRKPIVSGYISRTPSKVLALFQRPFLNELRARIYGDTTPYGFEPQELAQAANDVRDLNIGYIVLHRNELSSEAFEVLHTALVSVFAQPSYQDEQVTVWEVPR